MGFSTHGTAYGALALRPIQGFTGVKKLATKTTMQGSWKTKGARHKMVITVTI